MRYVAPATVDDVVDLLVSEPGARVFAGATDVVPQIRSGRVSPGTLIDLKRIDRLCAITRRGSVFTVGAAVPAADICAHAGLVSAFPGLVEASGLIGSEQIQNRCSWGGNLANASPAADIPPSLVVNSARAVIAGPDGMRTVPVAEVVTGPGTTSLGPGEFVVEFVLDEPPDRTADAYLRLIPRTEMDIAVVGAAARVTLSGDALTAAGAAVDAYAAGVAAGAVVDAAVDAAGAVVDAAGAMAAGAVDAADAMAVDAVVVDVVVVLGAVAPTVVRVSEVEAALVGSSPDGEALAAVEAAAAAACDPIDDKRGTAAYRRRVAGVLARRAVAAAAERALCNGGGAV